jgi:hypothetical protein
LVTVRSKLGLAGALVMTLTGIGLTAGGVISYTDQHSGTPGKVKVQECRGGYGRYGASVHCTGTWVVGGSLLGKGHAVIGQIDNAGYDDIGKTISVRFHGDRATKPSTRLPVILAVLGLWVLAAGIYFLVIWWRSGSRTAQPGAA